MNQYMNRISNIHYFNGCLLKIWFWDRGPQEHTSIFLRLVLQSYCIPATDILQTSCRTPFICYIPHWKSLSQVYVLSAANILQRGCRPKNFKLIGFHHHMSMRNHKKIWKKFHLLLLQNLAHMFKIVMLSPFGSLHMEILFANRILEKLLWLSSWKTKSVNFRNVRRGQPKYFKMLGSYVKW